MDKELSYRNNPKSLFKKYAKLVTWVGKLIDKDIALYLPNGHIKKLDEKTYRLEVSSRPVNTKALYSGLIAIDNLLYNIHSFTEAKDIMWWYLNGGRLPKLLRSFNFDSATLNPDANPESTSVDGAATRSSVNESFSTIRGGAGTSAQDTQSDNNAFRLLASSTTNQYQALDRGFFLFDTSSIGTVVISATTISFYPTTRDTTLLDTWNVVSSSPASNTAIAASDYAVANFGSTDFITSEPTTSGLTLNAYNDFSLNSNGISNIDGYGISKFGVRSAADIDNSAPTWADSANSFFTTEFADGTNDPKLTVTYTKVGGGAFLV